MSGDGNLFFASIGVNPGKSTTICDVAGLDSGIVIVNSCELYYQKPDKYQEHQKIGAVALISAQLLFLCKKITARPRKNLAVGVKLSYATN